MRGHLTAPVGPSKLFSNSVAMQIFFGVPVVFPSSSSLNGHPGRPGKRAAGGRGRPGARGPGRGPTVVWAQPGCLGAFSARAPPRSQSVDRSLCSNNRPRTSLLLRAARVLATPASTAEGPRLPRRQGRRATGRPVRLSGASELGS